MIGLNERLRDVMVYHDRAFFLPRHSKRRKSLAWYQKIAIVNIPDIKEPARIGTYGLQRVLSRIGSSQSLGYKQYASILVSTFDNEITNRLVSLKAQYASDINVPADELLAFINPNHPFFIAVGNDPYIRPLFSQEYGKWFRYTGIYGEIFKKEKGFFSQLVLEGIEEYQRTRQEQIINIGVIGSGYGQEPISIAILCERMIRTKLRQLGLAENAVKIKIHVLSKPNNVFQKLKDNQVIYSADSIKDELSNRYDSSLAPNIMREELGLFFEALETGFRRSAYLNEILQFYDVDLLDKNTYSALPKLNILSAHNVLQYLKRGEGISIEENRRFETAVAEVFGYMNSLLKEGGIFSVANEGGPWDQKITEEYSTLFTQSGDYSRIAFSDKFKEGARMFIKNFKPLCGPMGYRRTANGL